ncbi:hypothetical protein [Methylomagnum ishizawai]|uniref:hypothetical protein n=1 Tax=Methylomagnum ishizawai TaxID=1760988 RepID=UPI0015936411|nr:hypothetical protein [Methylomagnum ishizawai]
MADPHQDLKAVLSEHLPWHGARIGFLAHFLLALLKVRSVNLAELATGFGGPAKVESHYKRLQRFFRAFELDQDVLARLLVRLVPVGDGPWRLTLDRTNWKFGLAEINFLVLGIAHRGMAVPVFWSVLGKAGNSDTVERIALMERFLKVFGAAAPRRRRLPVHRLLRHPTGRGHRRLRRPLASGNPVRRFEIQGL